jgi:hypothetical protein
VGTRSEEDRFAEGLIQIRDDTISGCDRFATGKMIDSAEEPWRTVIQSPEIQQAVLAVIPEIVDRALWELVNAADNDDFPLAWRTADGTWQPLDGLGSGGLGGSYMAFWRQEFATERFRDVE